MAPSLVALATLLATSPAQAQSEAPAPTPDVVIASETVLDEGDFADLEVKGQLVGPGVHIDIERTPKPFPSWVRLRSDFAAEMTASLDVID